MGPGLFNSIVQRWNANPEVQGLNSCGCTFIFIRFKTLTCSNDLLGILQLQSAEGSVVQTSNFARFTLLHIYIFFSKFFLLTDKESIKDFNARSIKNSQCHNFQKLFFCAGPKSFKFTKKCFLKTVIGFAIQFQRAINHDLNDLRVTITEDIHIFFIFSPFQPTVSPFVTPIDLFLHSKHGKSAQNDKKALKDGVS